MKTYDRIFNYETHSGTFCLDLAYIKGDLNERYKRIKPFDELPIYLRVWGDGALKLPQDFRTSESFRVPEHPGLERKPPVLDFGIGVTGVQTLEYALRNGLIPLTKPLDIIYAHQEAGNHLTNLTGMKIEFFSPGHGNFRYVITLYTNYRRRRELGEKDERKVIELIKNELQTSENPRWYFHNDE